MLESPVPFQVAAPGGPDAVATEHALNLDPAQQEWRTPAAALPAGLPTATPWYVPPARGGAEASDLSEEAREQLEALGYGR